MSKGGKGGGGGGSTEVHSLPALNSIMSQLQGLTDQQQGYLKNPNALGHMEQYGQEFAENSVVGADAGMSPIQLAQRNIGNEEGLASQFQGDTNFANQMAQYGAGQVKAGNNEVSQLEHGSGLFGSQQAYIDQATKSGQSAVQQQMANEGLTSSTQNAMLQNQVAQSGAATAGQLVQGNISLAQQGTQIAQQLTMGEQGLSQASTGALQNLWTTAAGQWGGMQQQGFSQAMQGYGMIGQYFQGALQPYGYQLQAQNLLLQKELGSAQINANMITAEQSAQSGGMSSLMGGLSSLLGGGGGGGKGGLGGLLGGLGGAAGGIAAGGGAAAAGAGAAAAGGAGIGLDAAFTAAGLAFTCFLAIEVYGATNPKWKLFRTWLIFQAPRWLRKLYIEHAQTLAYWVHTRPLVKTVLRFMMDLAIR